jgi:hypothetical protein
LRQDGLWTFYCPVDLAPRQPANGSLRAATKGKRTGEPVPPQLGSRGLGRRGGRGKRPEVRCVYSEKESRRNKSRFFSALALKTLLSNVLSTVLSSSCLSVLSCAERKRPSRQLVIRKAIPARTQMVKFANKWLLFQQVKRFHGTWNLDGTFALDLGPPASDRSTLCHDQEK